MAFRFGLSAESRAAALLIAKGYRILAKRFRTPYGEIDLVARKRNLIAFIEVFAQSVGQARWSQAIVFAVLIIVLVFRPAGILGQQIGERA